MPPISVAMVVRDEEEGIRDALNSVVMLSDDIVVVDTGSSDATPDIASEFGRVVKTDEFTKKEWGGYIDFSAARNYSFSLCKNDVVLWIDGDDVLHGQQIILEECVPKFETVPRLACMMFPYYYEYDMHGVLITVQSRERLIDRRLSTWMGPVHETPVLKHHFLPQMSTERHYPEVYVEHKHSNVPVRHRESSRRNYMILRAVVDAGSTDPRHYLYLGQACYGLKRWVEAIQWYDRAVVTSGSTWDIAEALRRSAYCEMQMGYNVSALKRCQQADRVQADPRTYFMMAHACCNLGRYDECLRYTKMGFAIDAEPPMIHGLDPLMLNYRPFIVAHMAAFKLEQYDTAKEMIERAVENNPRAPMYVKRLVKKTERALKRIAVTRIFKGVENVWRSTNTVDPSDTAKAFDDALSRVPHTEQFRLHPPQFYQREYPSNDVAFVCGPGGDEWSAQRIKTGVGGSEEMVVGLTRALAKYGYEVSVYCKCGEGAGEDVPHVTYYPFEAFNADVERGTLVAWRMPEFSEYMRGRRKYLWMHDVATDAAFELEMHKSIDKVMCLSQWQRNNWPHLEEEKVVYTRNGIDAELYGNAVRRNKKRAIYASNPTRGLEIVLRNWKEIHRRTDAELWVYYGWMPVWKSCVGIGGYEYNEVRQHCVRMDEYQESLMRQVDDLKSHGLFWRGMVGHPHLERAFERSGVWLYPTPYPEISCITAMRAQAAGAVPVCTDFAALDETVQYGEKVHMKDEHDLSWEREWVEQTVRMLNDLDYQEDCRNGMITWALNKYSMTSLAAQWDAVFQGARSTVTMA